MTNIAYEVHHFFFALGRSGCVFSPGVKIVMLAKLAAAYNGARIEATTTTNPIDNLTRGADIIYNRTGLKNILFWRIPNRL